MHRTLQKINTSMVTQTIARFRKTFDLITFFIQESAEKHIPSKTSRSTSSVPWITPEIRRKIRRRNRTHAKAKKTGSSKLRAKFESLRKERTRVDKRVFWPQYFRKIEHVCLLGFIL